MKSPERSRPRSSRFTSSASSAIGGGAWTRAAVISSATDSVFKTLAQDRQPARRTRVSPTRSPAGWRLQAHGFRRLTDDVDILVTREGLKTIHEQLEGLGYVPPFTGSKNLRDTEYGVRIEFLIAGEFPGDGKPKPVAFPDPERGRRR